MTDDRREMLLDELLLETAEDEWYAVLVDAICNDTRHVPADIPDEEYERLRAEHYYPERAACIAALGRRLRNTHATLCAWDYVDLVSLERVLVAIASGTTADLGHDAPPGHFSEREILAMLRADALPLSRPRIRKPRRTQAAALRDIPRRTYESRRQRLRKPAPCLPNRLAAHAPPSASVARSRAMTAPARLVTHNTGPP